MGRKDGAKSAKHYSFMVRTRIPGGRLTSEQLLAEMDLCDEVGNTTLRITSRQGLQLHGVVKHDLWKTIHRINEIQLSTLAACGDVVRNIMCCPAPFTDPIHQELRQLTDDLVANLAPRTKAYHEIWLTDPESGEETLVGGGSESAELEPLYGPTYLPRKFKVAVGLASDNCVDLYANDLGFMAIVEGGKIIGYNVLVGGGMGVTPSAEKTFPAVAKRMAFIKPEQAIDVAKAVIMVQRDFGNRADRKIARLKYLIHNWGLKKYKAKVEEYYGRPLADPHPEDVHGFDDHIGWHEQGDGRLFYGLNVENGRIHDHDEFRLKSALREICRTLKPGIRLTAHQSILFTDVDPADREQLESILRSHGIKLSEEISNVRRWSMACVAWPTCGLAITESERALPGIIDQLEVELAKLGLSNETFTLRMTGCPNGCARPYNCDIGLVGKAVGKYTIFAGGRLLGDRLNFNFRDMVPADEVVPTLVPLLAYFKQDRTAGETLGDFCHRKGRDDLVAWTDAYTAQNAPAETQIA
jgi:sulfite reductase (ferredoxin)